MDHGLSSKIEYMFLPYLNSPCKNWLEMPGTQVLVVYQQKKEFLLLIFQIKVMCNEFISALHLES